MAIQPLFKNLQKRRLNQPPRQHLPLPNNSYCQEVLHNIQVPFSNRNKHIICLQMERGLLGPREERILWLADTSAPSPSFGQLHHLRQEQRRKAANLMHPGRKENHKREK